MGEIVPVPPILYGAAGTALGYYSFRFLARQEALSGVLALMVALVSVLHVLACHPWATGLSVKVQRQMRRFRIYALVLALGVALGLSVGSQISALWFGIPEDQVRGLYGSLTEDPRAFPDYRGMASLSVYQVEGPGGLKASARGSVQVFFPADSFPRIQAFGRGSVVYLPGTLITPPQATGNTPPKRFRAQALHLLKPASALEQRRTRGRMRLRERLEDAPWAGLAEALLLGVKDNLDTEVAVAFRSAGCSHILALSGMHLALLTTVLTFLLTRVLGLKAAAVGGGLGIIAYVYMAGNFPSLTRAAIMYLLGSLCALGPFPKSGVRVRQRAVLGMAFIIQLIGSPQAGQSLSFILSYLALGGLLFIAPAIHDLFRGRLPEILAQPLAASIGAFIATAPVSAWVFGVLRPVGILAGLLIVPLVTAFMLIALAAWILPGTALGLILTILYDILTGIAAGSARIPGISGAAPWVVMTLSLGSAGVLMAVSHRQTLRRSILVPFD